MHKPPLAPIIYATLFPNPKPGDPQNFQTHISKQLVPEVRLETARFYGHINCIEAQYPGLDYASPAHRLRLSRFQHHRRLFQAFDHLRLTDYEIQTLCKWEGTRWARERYEKDIGSSVRDTTWDDVILAIPEPPTVTRTPLSVRNRSGFVTQPTSRHGRIPGDNVNVMRAMAQDMQDGQDLQATDEEAEDEEYDEDEEDEDQQAGESEDELQQSVGVELNQRLVAATEARNRGEEAVLDPAWEQWLKEAAERGTVPDVMVANAGPTFASQSNTWGQHMPEDFGNDTTHLAPSAHLSMPDSANQILDGTSAPPAGTAM
ncbi:MAG: hypothetical protein Q9218_001680 [Villophora microphyllina]